MLKMRYMKLIWDFRATVEKTFCKYYLNFNLFLIQSYRISLEDLKYIEITLLCRISRLQKYMEIYTVSLNSASIRNCDNHKRTMKVVHMNLVLYSKHSEVIWYLCARIRLIFKTLFTENLASSSQTSFKPHEGE